MMWVRVGFCPQVSPTPLYTTDENKSTKTRSAWGGKVVDISKEKGQESVAQWAFIGCNLHRNTGCILKAQSLSGSNDQTLDNIHRTMKVYLDSRSESLRAIKLWGNKLILCLDPYYLN